MPKIISFFVALRTFGEKKTRLKPAEAKTTPFRIRNSLVKTFLQYLESPSLAVGVPAGTMVLAEVI